MRRRITLTGAVVADCWFLTPHSSYSPRIKNLGDIGMVHHCQGLPLGLEAGDDLPAVYPRLDDLQSDLALDGLRLLGHEDGAHAALPDLLQELVGADDGAGTFPIGLIDGLVVLRNSLEEMPRLVVHFEQQFNALAQLGVTGTSLIQKGRQSNEA